VITRAGIIAISNRTRPKSPGQYFSLHADLSQAGPEATSHFYHCENKRSVMTEETREKTTDIDAEALARRCVSVCEERKAVDILLFDVREQTILADYFIVCSGTSLPHLRAISDHVRRELQAAGVRPRGADGSPSSQWLVLDYGIILVHIMMPEMRHYYCLEDLWDKRKIIYRGGEPMPPVRPGQGRANAVIPPHLATTTVIPGVEDEDEDEDEDAP